MPWSGLEPLCLSAPPPQDGVSTNFTTRATSITYLAAAAGCTPSAPSCFLTGPTGLEPATSRVTVECSNQTELRPQLLSRGRKPLPHYTCLADWLSDSPHFKHSPKGNRTPLCTVKGGRPNQ